LANGDPTIFVSDAAGNLMQFVWTRFPQPDRPGGFTSTNYGSLLGTAMGAPTALAWTGPATAFSVSSNRHVGETHVSGTRPGLIDHAALSRVIYQAHRQIKNHFSWGGLVNEGQSVANVFPDAFRVQSTLAGSVLCQAYAEGIGWLPEVYDGQTCGTTPGRGTTVGRHVEAIRFRLADAGAGMHVLYRCNIGTWTPWVADGTSCGGTGLSQPVTAIQLQFSDAPLSDVTYRAQSQDAFGWQPWVDEGVASGTPGGNLDGIEVHSNVGGWLRCQPYVQDKGWQNQVADDALCGTVGESRRLEAFTLDLTGRPPGEGVQYRSFVAGLGWQPWVADGQVSGLPGQGLQIEQVQVQFTH